MNAIGNALATILLVGLLLGVWFLFSGEPDLFLTLRDAAIAKVGGK